MKRKDKYYHTHNIRKIGAAINMIYGERGPGKSFAMLYEVAMTDYWEARKKGDVAQTVYVRRRDKTMDSAFCNSLFSGIISPADGSGNRVIELTEGEYSTIVYKQSAWWFANVDEVTGLTQMDTQPFMFKTSLNTAHNVRSAGRFEHVRNLWYEEFMRTASEAYLPNEFAIFQDLISTVLRKRENTYVWMTGNAIDFLCPYFENFGLKRMIEQPQGTIWQFKLGRTNNTIACERTDARESIINEEYRFAFDTPETNMIAGGEWQIGLYPMLPVDINIAPYISGRFQLYFKDYHLYGDVICSAEDNYLYMHQDPDPLNPVTDEQDLTYSKSISTRMNWRRSFDTPMCEGEQWIRQLIKLDKVYYDSPVTGFVFDSFLRA